MKVFYSIKSQDMTDMAHAFWGKTGSVFIIILLLLSPLQPAFGETEAPGSDVPDSTVSDTSQEPSSEEETEVSQDTPVADAEPPSDEDTPVAEDESSDDTQPPVDEDNPVAEGESSDDTETPVDENVEAPDEIITEQSPATDELPLSDEQSLSSDTASSSQASIEETTPQSTSTSLVAETASQDTSTSSSSTEATTTSETFVTPLSQPSLSVTSSSTEESGTTTSTSTGTTSIENVDESEFDAVATTGTPTIVSGDSIALANILNLVNTSFVNSEGVIVFENFFEALFGDFDLRAFYNAITGFGCSLVSCNDSDVTINISNDAIIRNSLSVQALTGNNSISGGATSTISTGDAYAGLNLINVANTSVIDSNYLLVTMNAFNDVNGDIVFPSLDQFFSTLASGGASPETINITNSADVTNNVQVNTGTGNNTVEGSGSSTISTGSSGASTNVFNQLNTSLIGGQNVSILFRVHGTWAGEIFGAPSNLSWMEDGTGGIYLFDTGTGGSQTNAQTLNVANNAHIENNINVVALTGENAITGAQTALISTGNAYAGANIVNVANATVVGRNWILAIINILGDFTGNISFGRPDLWIGAQVDVSNTIENGSDMTYKLSVINNGDALASQVFLTDDYDERYVDIIDSSVPYSAEAGKLTWDLGTLLPGTATEITYTARVKGTSYSTDIENMLMVFERETDNNRSDNSDTITVTTSGKPTRNGSGVRISLGQENGQDGQSSVSPFNNDLLQITRVTASSSVENDAQSTVHQELVVKNNSDHTVTQAVLHDVLTAPSGETITNEVWELGSVLPQEEISITYDVTFGDKAAAGLYTLATVFEGANLTSSIQKQNGRIYLLEKLAMFPIQPDIIPSAPMVLGVTTSTPEEGSVPEPRISSLSFFIPTAYGAGEKDHGLPMTHVPYRYSAYFFFLVIMLGNWYYMVRASHFHEDF